MSEALQELVATARALIDTGLYRRQVQAEMKA